MSAPYREVSSRLKRLLTEGRVIEGSLYRSDRGNTPRHQLSDRATGRFRNIYVPRLADAVEKRVEDLAEAGEEGDQPFERRVAVGHFRRGPPDALPFAPLPGFATVLRPVLAVIASTSSARAIALISLSRRFASAQFADHAATSSAKSAGM